MSILEINHVGSNESEWFEIAGVVTGIDEKGQCCDFEGSPHCAEWYDQNSELVEQLTEARDNVYIGYQK